VEVRPAEVRPCEVRLGEVHLPEALAAQVRLAEVDSRVLSPPLVPNLDPFHELREMFTDWHGVYLIKIVKVR
jgi:hypothetical protein